MSQGISIFNSRIASVHFAPLMAARNYRSEPYFIPAWKRGTEPQILIIEQRLQYDRTAYNGQKFRELITKLVQSYEIAHDLVKQWTNYGIYMSEQAHPGVWFVRDRLPVMNEDGTQMVDLEKKAVFREATPEEKRQMWEEDLHANMTADAAYADILISKGMEIHNSPEKHISDAGSRPSDLMKLAARAFGVDAPFLHQTTDANLKTCPVCTSKIHGAAIKCPKCLEVIDQVAFDQYKKRAREVAIEVKHLEKQQQTA